jgi:hypothetical protein
LLILAKQIIVNPQGKIGQHELNLPFANLHSLVQNLSTPGSGDGSSEHVRLGVQQKPPTDQAQPCVLSGFCFALPPCSSIIVLRFEFDKEK